MLHIPWGSHQPCHVFCFRLRWQKPKLPRSRCRNPWCWHHKGRLDIRCICIKSLNHIIPTIQTLFFGKVRVEFSYVNHWIFQPRIVRSCLNSNATWPWVIAPSWKAKAKAKGKAKSKAKAKAAPKAKASHDSVPIVGSNSTIWSFIWVLNCDDWEIEKILQNWDKEQCVICHVFLRKSMDKNSTNHWNHKVLTKSPQCVFWKLATCCAWQAKAKVRDSLGWLVSWLELQICHDRLKPKPRARMPRWHSWRPSPRPWHCRWWRMVQILRMEQKRWRSSQPPL